MAYIHWGAALPSGDVSHSYVIGSPDCLMSFGEGSKFIPYPELLEWFETKTCAEIKILIKERLFLTDEEDEMVCDRLFEEHKAGEWTREVVEEMMRKNEEITRDFEKRIKKRADEKAKEKPILRLESPL